MNPSSPAHFPGLLHIVLVATIRGMRRRRLFISIGTRPEAVKLAPLVRVCRARPDVFEAFVCLSGQHRDLVAPLVEYFDLKPACDLRVMSPNQNLAELTSRCIRKVDDALGQYQPDFVIVQGDTTTAAATAQAALFRKRAIVHVEAGLRTGNIQSPFPEEFNRRMISLAATFHCAPTEHAAANLKREGVPDERIRVTGNTGIDALLWTAGRERARPWSEADPVDGDYSAYARASSPYNVSPAKPTVLITAHRRESFGDGIAAICDAVRTLAQRYPDHAFVWPVHPNPKIEKPVRAALKNLPNISLVPAMEYPQFVSWMDISTLILTDSGGVQEEAPSLRKPVLVMRADTERPEGIAAGCAELVGVDAERIVERAAHHLEAAKKNAARGPIANPYGDGKAAERIADWLAEFDADKL
jgi:UDP-N-acetylglucosamine 2-epimerase (non-hydrolysing)